MQLLNEVTACVSLLAQHKQLPFLNRIITGNEKWISQWTLSKETYDVHLVGLQESHLLWNSLEE